ncbi:unnamed protein product [Ilex paraguariensis]|uniref:BSD domain-containing protein n=1 Tax=Ilex paraguariensis TaxID=185542 RepID=A0ABC8UIU4_9AQUA
MDFFKTVFSDELQQSDSPASPSNSHSDDSEPSSPSSNPNPSPRLSSITDAWTFGSTLFKSLASKSESVIEACRRDLGEFSSGLKNETQTVREAASRTVKDLPARLEIGAAVAQDSLESVGQAVDNIGSTVSRIIVLGKSSILKNDSDTESDGSDKNNSLGKRSNSRPHSRLNGLIHSIQCDVRTYCEEVEDLEDYNEWKLGFRLDEKSGEIDNLVEENAMIADIYNGVVPSQVDRETFWRRYFYRVYKVKKVEEARAKLVKRALSGQEEEELSWDVDDDEDDEESGGFKLTSVSQRGIEEKSLLEKNVGKSTGDNEGKGLEREIDDKGGVFESTSISTVDEKEMPEAKSNKLYLSGDKLGVNSDEKVSKEGKNYNSDFSVISSQPSSHEEGDLWWDEIDDIGSGDEVKVVTAALGSPNRADLRQRLSAANEEEDLTWDIEDYDEPVKH